MKALINLFVFLFVFVFPLTFGAKTNVDFEEDGNETDNDGFIKILDKTFWDKYNKNLIEETVIITPDFFITEYLISESEAKINILSNVLNCETCNFDSIDNSILKSLNVEKLENSTKIEILHEFCKLENNSLFEMYAHNNWANILSEIKTLRDFHFLIFSCIRAKSLVIFRSALADQIFPINVPRALALAATKGSNEILKYIIENSSNQTLKLNWNWRTFEDENGTMLHLGNTPFSASLSIAASKAIQVDNLDCIIILLSYNLDVSYQNFKLLKETASRKDSQMFKLLAESCVLIPDSISNEILILAIQNKNMPLIEHLFTLNVNLDIKYTAPVTVETNTNQYSCLPDTQNIKIPISTENSKSLKEKKYFQPNYDDEIIYKYRLSAENHNELTNGLSVDPQNNCFIS